VFDTAGIPYQIVSRENIFNTKYISELISLLKVMEGTGGFLDFERSSKVITPNINSKYIQIFKYWGYENGFPLESALINARKFPIHKMGKTNQSKLGDIINKIFEIRQKSKKMSVKQKLLFLLEDTNISTVSDWDPNINNALNKIIDVCESFDSDNANILKTTALQADTDLYDYKSESVALMTIHAAKGLEFPFVFIVGCENGLLPFQPLNSDESDIEEERRLFYVAMTRAKEQLYITFANKRKKFGKIERRTLSPFVQRIEKNLLTHHASNSRKKPQTGPLQLKLF
jgi:DNA helicase-2/ATP-dependent DNA helicase PcrA